MPTATNVVTVDSDTIVDVSELTTDSSMSNNLQSDLAHKKNSNLRNKKSAPSPSENVKLLKRNSGLNFIKSQSSIVDRSSNLQFKKERLLMNKEIGIAIRNKDGDDDVGGGGGFDGGGGVNGGDNSVNGGCGKFVCEACASAGRILPDYFDSNFHPCVLDPVIENFRTKAGPIARPVKNFGQSKQG